MRRFIISLVAILSLLGGNVMAESIDGRLGFIGRLGAVVPLADSEIEGASFWLSDVGFAAGGGLIYGFGKHFAAEVEAINIPSLDVKMESGDNVSEASFTDVSIGLLYRFMPEGRLVPYLGAGGDFVKGDIDSTTLEWAVGGHVRGGLDYFINKGIAFNVDCKAIFTEESDITMNGRTVGAFDPMSVITTFGVRLFLPDKI